MYDPRVGTDPPADCPSDSTNCAGGPADESQTCGRVTGRSRFPSFPSSGGSFSGRSSFSVFSEPECDESGRVHSAGGSYPGGNSSPPPSTR